MKCPNCGAANAVHETRDIPYEYKGITTVFSAVPGTFCDACGEATFDLQEADHYGELVAAFVKNVNAAVVDPSFISGVRKKLRLDQREAGRIFGGGDNAFSRYENGKTQPSLALLKLLKVLDRHPELLPEVKEDLPVKSNQALTHASH